MTTSCAMCELIKMQDDKAVAPEHRMLIAYCLGRKVARGVKEPSFCEQHDLEMTMLEAMLDKMAERFAKTSVTGGEEGGEA